MENRERFVIEVLLGLILIVFLIILIFLVVGISKKPTQSSAQVPIAITNSYNTNYYNTNPQARTYSTTRPIVQYTNSKTEDKNRFMYFEDDGRLRKSEGLFGNDINTYEVYVRNEEYKGGYFEVTFYFEDHYGKTSRNSIINYVPPRESKRFFYKDVSPQRYKYRDWWYDVKPLSKVPKNDRYDDEDDYYSSYSGYYGYREPMNVYYYR